MTLAKSKTKFAKPKRSIILFPKAKNDLQQLKTIAEHQALERKLPKFYNNDFMAIREGEGGKIN